MALAMCIRVIFVQARSEIPPPLQSCTGARAFKPRVCFLGGIVRAEPPTLAQLLGVPVGLGVASEEKSLVPRHYPFRPRFDQRELIKRACPRLLKFKKSCAQH